MGLNTAVSHQKEKAISVQLSAKDKNKIYKAISY
jgi:hypothetical protein